MSTTTVVLAVERLGAMRNPMTPPVKCGGRERVSWLRANQERGRGTSRSCPSWVAAAFGTGSEGVLINEPVCLLREQHSSTTDCTPNNPLPDILPPALLLRC